MNYLDNFFNFSLYRGKYDLHLSQGEGEFNVFFSPRNSSLLYSSHSIWAVTASAYRKSPLWTGGLPGLPSPQTLSHLAAIPKGLCLSQALVLTGSKDEYFSVTINSCYFKIFYLNLSQNLGVMIGSSFSLFPSLTAILLILPLTHTFQITIVFINIYGGLRYVSYCFKLMSWSQLVLMIILSGSYNCFTILQLKKLRV